MFIKLKNDSKAQPSYLRISTEDQKQLFVQKEDIESLEKFCIWKGEAALS